MEVEEILALNSERMAAREAIAEFDPVAGDIMDPRRVPAMDPEGHRVYVPREMTLDPEYGAAQRAPELWRTLRHRYDFPFWCADCVRIKPKNGYIDSPFVLNAAQRRVLEILEEQRRAGLPVRLILLKARQWGGTTLVQVYMAWIQLVHRPNWHSVIVSHGLNTSVVVRGMYDKLLANYPEPLWPEEGKRPALKAVRGANNTYVIPGRECCITLASANRTDSIRGSDIAMAHLTEVAFWADTLTRSPDDLVRSVCGSVPLVPYSVVVYESTANGVGNFFHREWVRAAAGQSSMRTAFVPWFEIALYRTAPPDECAFAASLTDYESLLFAEHGLCLDQLYWYRQKRSEFNADHEMMAEYPSTPEEAFAATTHMVFDREKVEALRANCRRAERGELSESLNWTASSAGCMELWSAPEPGEEYIVAVDIGGRTAAADWSVATVLRLGAGDDESVPEIVAQWRGHIDHDLLADTARRIAQWYNGALLVVESNTLESAADGHGEFILNRLADQYANLYFREDGDRVGEGAARRPGFHTNRRTKDLAIATLVAAVREGRIIERSEAALNEFLTYEITPDGRYSAKRGCHDDMLMTRAIALTVASARPPRQPVEPYHRGW